MTELEKCMAGEWYDCHAPEFIEGRARALEWCARYNATPYSQRSERRKMLEELFGAVGTNVSVGDNFEPRERRVSLADLHEAHQHRQRLLDWCECGCAARSDDWRRHSHWRRVCRDQRHSGKCRRRRQSVPRNKRNKSLNNNISLWQK